MISPSLHNASGKASTILYLASGSRFRRQMLATAGITVVAEPADIDEPAERAAMTATEPEICPAAVAVRLAGLKAVQISARHPDDLVIGADQILALKNSIFGKPADLAAARAQLTALRGQTHTLPTAVVLARGGKVIWKHVATAEMTMRNFDDAFLESYLAAVGMTVTETCGGYQLEGLGVQLFDRIDGDYFTVIGLPLLPLLAELRRCGAIPS